MKAETQHLDFLISQYVDGALEGAGKKSVEQKMLHDPDARKLYAEHREVQDLLDDYGSRIPMINWGEFDKKLDARLEVEAREKQRVSRFRRRMKPVAAAAALVIAASLGFTLHAFSQGKTTALPATQAKVDSVVPQTAVIYPESISVTRPFQWAFGVDEAGASGLAGGSVDGIAYGAPADRVALQALETNIRYGFENLIGSVTPQMTPAPGSAVGATDTVRPQNDDGDLRFLK